MVSPNWKNERYTPSPSEQCCKCGESLGEAGAYYWGRVRVCQYCHREAKEWQSDEQIQDFIALETMLRMAGWSAVCLASAAIAGCVVSLFI